MKYYQIRQILGDYINEEGGYELEKLKDITLALYMAVADAVDHKKEREEVK